MEKINKNPIAYFLVVGVGGMVAIANDNFESFVVFILAIIVAKQVEILSK